jgi:isoquinoline 1-oxidoreductase subunit alpha
MRQWQPPAGVARARIPRQAAMQKPNQPPTPASADKAARMEPVPNQLTINGKPYFHDGDAAMPLLWYLRDVLRLTGTKYGCGIGACGACTVLVDGKAARACQTPMQALAGREITTIEGLEGAALHPVQQAWLENDVAQCGYCQAGQIMAAVDLLRRKRMPSDEDIAGIGNLCRCGTYPRIRSAIQRAAALMSEPKS